MDIKKAQIKSFIQLEKNGTHQTHANIFPNLFHFKFLNSKV